MANTYNLKSLFHILSIIVIFIYMVSNYLYLALFIPLGNH